MQADSEQYINQLERENERMAKELGIAIAVIDECHALIESAPDLQADNERLTAEMDALADALAAVVEDLVEAHENEIARGEFGCNPNCTYCLNVAAARAALKAAGR